MGGHEFCLINGLLTLQGACVPGGICWTWILSDPFLKDARASTFRRFAGFGVDRDMAHAAPCVTRHSWLEPAMSAWKGRDYPSSASKAGIVAFQFCLHETLESPCMSLPSTRVESPWAPLALFGLE